MSYVAAVLGESGNTGGNQRTNNRETPEEVLRRSVLENPRRSEAEDQNRRSGQESSGFQGGMENTRILSDVSLNPSSPFFINAGENPSLVLVTQLLNSRNYFSWSRSIKGSLLAKHKFCFVDGSLPLSVVPEQHHPAWHRCNQLVLSWLKHALSPSIAQSIIWFDTATQVWQNLKNRFSQRDALHIAELQDEVLSTVQGDMSVTDYFTKLQIIWEEFINFRSIPDCEFTNLSSDSCLAIRKVRSYQSQDFIIKFLRGLNNSFGMVKSQILIMDLLPPVDRVFNLVLQHERQLEGSQVLIAPMDSTVHYANSQRSHGNTGFVNNAPKKQFGKKGPKCSYCDKDGHVVDQCFKKHGYPPNFKHKKRFAANISAENEPSGSVLQVPQNNTGVTPEQYAKLMDLLQHFDPTAVDSSLNNVNTQHNVNALKSNFTHQGSFEQEDDWYS